MKMKYVVSITLIALLYACGGNTDQLSVETLKEKIAQKEDSLKMLQESGQPIPQNKHYELIESLLQFYYTHPKDPEAPVCLDKVQMAYSGLGVYFKAVQYADTLIEKYPKYINRAMVLESQAANYDYFFTPRDTNKIKYYNQLLLKENPKMDKEKRAGIEMKLKHLDLGMEEYLDFVARELNKSKK